MFRDNLGHEYPAETLRVLADGRREVAFLKGDLLRTRPRVVAIATEGDGLGQWSWANP